MKSRIAPIDGLRACAVLGVMWAHAWMAFGNIPLKFGPVDVNKILSFGGVGVDLFFVISGFCMYLMYQKKATDFNLKEYFDFLLKRWKRIAPAFYFVVFVECLLYLWVHGRFPFDSFIAHLLFVNTFISNNVLSPPFWSLSTEWQFYILLPIIFIHDITGSRRLGRIIWLMIMCLIIRLVLFYFNSAEIHSGVTVLSDKIWYRFIEFGWGMIAARSYLMNRRLPKLFLGFGGFLFSLGLAFLGRLCMVTEIYNHFYPIAFLLKAFAEPLLTLGFTLMLLNVVESKSIFSYFLERSWMQFLGRISYSMYLWHWIILWSVCSWWITKTPVSNVNLNLAFVVSVMIVVLISTVSYRLLEAPYFRSTLKKQRVVNLKEAV